MWCLSFVIGVDTAPGLAELTWIVELSPNRRVSAFDHATCMPQLTPTILEKWLYKIRTPIIEYHNGGFHPFNSSTLVETSIFGGIHRNPAKDEVETTRAMVVVEFNNSVVPTIDIINDDQPHSSQRLFQSHLPI